MVREQVKMGDYVRDMVTDVQGIIVARYEYITGCVRMDVQPQGVTPDGKMYDGYIFDLPRLEYLRPGLTPEQMEQIGDIGGPGERPAQHRTPER